jgi:hypothetical protein
MFNWAEYNKFDPKDQAAMLAEASDEDLMAEAKHLHDLVYNVGCATADNMAHMEAIYAELLHRGYSVNEQYTVTFIESIISTN